MDFLGDHEDITFFWLEENKQMGGFVVCILGRQKKNVMQVQ